MKFPRLISLFLLALAMNAPGAPKEEPPPPPPPMAQPQIVSIYRGRTVEIPLHAIGRASGQLKFLIRTKPKYGKLGTIVPTGNKTAVVTYTHNGDAGTGADIFSFAVQGPNTPVSAPGKVQIAISEEPPAFSVVHSLDFGTVLLGEQREEEITIRNSGGGWLIGSVLAPLPWKVLGDSKYKLARNEEMKVRVLFAPTEAREYTEKLVFSHDARSPVTLTGNVTSPFELNPAREVEVVRQDAGTVRSGGLVIHNVTSRERVIEVTVPEKISAPDQVTAGPDGEARVAFHTSPDFLGQIEGEIVLESEGYRQSIPLKAPAFPPILEVEPKDGLAFGNIPVSEPQKLKVTVKNTGGTAARLRVSTPPNLLLIPEPNSAFIEQGQSRTFEATLETGVEGSYKGELEISAEGATPVKLPVTAQIANSQTVVTALPAPAPEPVTTGTAAILATPDAARLIVEEKDPFSPDIPVIDEVRVLTRTSRNLELGWKKPAPNVTPMIEQRMIQPTGNASPPKVTWRRLDNIKYSEREGLIVARIENLAQGQSWYLRISSIDDTGRRSAPSDTIQLSTNPAKKSSLPLILLGFVLAAAAGFGLYKYTQHRNEADADRLSRIESGKH